VRHVPELVARVESAEPGEREAAEKALARGGATLAAALDSALPGAGPDGRARLARVLARFAAERPELVRARLLGLLDDDEPRVCRAALRGLGRVGGAGVEAQILERLQSLALPEARAAVEALGKIGGADSRQALERFSRADPELARLRDRALVMLGRSAGGDPVDIDVERSLEGPTDVVLTCRRGLEDVLGEELATAGVGRETARGPGRVELDYRGPLRPLFERRVALDVGLRVRLHESRSLEAALLASLEESAPLLARLSTGIPRFRLAFRGRGAKKATQFRVARALDPERLVNAPRGAPIEAVVDERTLEVIFYLRPSRELRFAYRGRDVPAASHPSIAAALARVAGVEADDVVWDPFVGSGLELCERGLLGPFRRLVGSDLSERALGAARVNLERAGLRAELVRADARTLTPAGVTLIVTNPPMGRRIARDRDLGALVDAAIDHFARVLLPGGRLVWLSPLPARSASRIASAGLALERIGRVDLGGFDAELQRARRR